MSFSFLGKIPASKSVYNRLAIIEDYAENFSVRVDSTCDDIKYMQSALKDLAEGRKVDCGEAGTVLRFMAFRASRKKGTHTLKGSKRLFSRPQSELLSILKQLDVDVEMKEEIGEMVIHSNGWKPLGDSIQVHAHRSSQFASALFLNAWGLDFPLAISITGSIVSKAYLDLTLQMVKYCGMKLESYGRDYTIFAHQKVNEQDLKVEPDMSSAFVIAAMAALSGEARIHQFPKYSFQPDFKFVKVLKQMGVELNLDPKYLMIKKPVASLKPIEFNLSSCPDMFPVLAVLCSFIEGKSKLFGAPHLKYKESDRLLNIANFLKSMGKNVDLLDDGMIIHGDINVVHERLIELDTDHDHRMVMAGSLAFLGGYQIKMNDVSVVDKSFPEFKNLIPKEAY